MSMQYLKNIKTGIKGLDLTLNGGLPEGHGILVTGAPGSGKTVLMSQFIYQGINKYNQKGVFVTFGEHPEDIVKNVKSFGWDFEKLVKQKKLVFVDLSPSIEVAEEVSASYNLIPILERIKLIVRETKAERVVIDGIEFLFQKFSNSRTIRQVIYRIYDELKQLGVMCIISQEKIPLAIEDNGFEELFSDGIIELTKEYEQDKVVRFLNITRMRGTGYKLGKVAFRIDNEGLEIFQNAQKDIPRKISFRERHKFGVGWLDEALSGGIPDGHIVLVSGNSGTGKTTLGINFILEGIRKREKGIYISLAESSPELKEIAHSHSWHLDDGEEKNLIRFIDATLANLNLDELLHQIAAVMDEFGAKRVVFDSVSVLDLAVKDKEKIKYFLIQLSSLMKRNGATCILNYLTGSTNHSGSDQLRSIFEEDELGLSSISDGILMMRYIQKRDTVKKILNILKLRGSEHKKEFFSYDINKNGFQLGSLKQTTIK